MSINLQRFCATEDPRPLLMAPWRLDGWVYATNGHICVRTPDNGTHDIAEYITGKHPRAHELFTRWFADGPEFQPLPALPAGQKCSMCNGIGAFAAKRCEACAGEGSFIHLGMEYDCKSCDSDRIEAGWVITDDDATTPGPGETMKQCNNCWGRKLEMCAQPLGDATYELAYLLWVAELPAVTYRTNGGTDPAVFRFDGGQALLMPRKQ